MKRVIFLLWDKKNKKLLRKTKKCMVITFFILNYKLELTHLLVVGAVVFVVEAEQHSVVEAVVVVVVVVEELVMG